MSVCVCVSVQCIDCIQQDGAKDLPAGAQVVILVNNLGATPIMEMYITARAALNYAQEKYKVSLSCCLACCAMRSCRQAVQKGSLG